MRRDSRDRDAEACRDIKTDRGQVPYGDRKRCLGLKRMFLHLSASLDGRLRLFSFVYFVFTAPRGFLGKPYHSLEVVQVLTKLRRALPGYISFDL